MTVKTIQKKEKNKLFFMKYTILNNGNKFKSRTNKINKIIKSSKETEKKEISNIDKIAYNL